MNKKIFILSSILLILILIIYNSSHKEVENFKNNNNLLNYIHNLDLKINFNKNNNNYKNLGTNRNYSQCCFIDKNKSYFNNQLKLYFNSHPQKIEKIIHQVWIGPKPVPYKWINTFKKFVKNNKVEI